MMIPSADTRSVRSMDFVIYIVKRSIGTNMSLVWRPRVRTWKGNREREKSKNPKKIRESIKIKILKILLGSGNTRRKKKKIWKEGKIESENTNIRREGKSTENKEKLIRLVFFKLFIFFSKINYLNYRIRVV